MIIKVYHGDNPLILSEKYSGTGKKFNGIPQQNDVAELLKITETESVQLVNSDLSELKSRFFGLFTNLIACGGLVQNEKKEVLFILRKGKWDFPKGKIEDGESLEDCAEREIEEETGVKNLIYKHKICETHHIYKEKEVLILKTSHWFSFTTKKQKLKPQTEEDITEVKWIATSDISKPMKNTYSTIKDVVHTYFDKP